MTKKQEWTVRVINFEDRNNTASSPLNNQLPGLWIEQLRHLGMARELAHFDDPDRGVLEFYCQDQRIDTKVWAEQNAARMRSFGIDAAAAPKWDQDGYGRPSTQKGEAQHMERFNRPRR
jgi:hypothetical protein